MPWCHRVFFNCWWGGGREGIKEDLHILLFLTAARFILWTEDASLPQTDGWHSSRCETAPAHGACGSIPRGGREDPRLTDRLQAAGVGGRGRRALTITVHRHCFSAYCVVVGVCGEGGGGRYCVSFDQKTNGISVFCVSFLIEGVVLK